MRFMCHHMSHIWDNPENFFISPDNNHKSHAQLIFFNFPDILRLFSCLLNNVHMEIVRGNLFEKPGIRIFQLYAGNFPITTLFTIFVGKIHIQITAAVIRSWCALKIAQISFGKRNLIWINWNSLQYSKLNLP